MFFDCTQKNVNNDAEADPTLTPEKTTIENELAWTMMEMTKCRIIYRRTLRKFYKKMHRIVCGLIWTMMILFQDRNGHTPLTLKIMLKHRYAGKSANQFPI